MSVRLIVICSLACCAIFWLNQLNAQEIDVTSSGTIVDEIRLVKAEKEPPPVTVESRSKATASFDPVEQTIEGWKVHVDPKMLNGEHAEAGAKALKMLENHLFFVSLLAPERRLKELRGLEIWIEHRHPSLTNMQYHPSAGWLTKNGHDPRLAKKVHIPIASQLLDRRQLMKHPMVVLHELSHAYHDQVLGFNEPRIIKVFKKAKASKKYEQVLSDTGRQVRHYALSNHKEYFAESTEAYFNRNDFYPFVQAELKEHDPDMHALMREIWGDLRRGK